MQSGGSEHTQSLDNKKSIEGTGIYRWGCQCCGPKDKNEKQMIHQMHRSKVKRDLKKEIDDMGGDD